jgi:ribA/ribD-fused uncharacterized protein
MNIETLDGIKEDKMIDSFRSKYRFLSNFYPSIVNYCDEVDDRDYPTVEHAYQAAKSEQLKDRIKIAWLATPGEAKRQGQLLTLRQDWEKMRLTVMEHLVRQKFYKHKELASKLLATGNEELVEGNTWGDRFWGRVDNNGENHLGRILMKVREELREQEQVRATSRS